MSNEEVAFTRNAKEAASSSEEQENTVGTANDKQSVQGKVFANNDPAEKKRKEKKRIDKRGHCHKKHCRSKRGLFGTKTKK